MKMRLTIASKLSKTVTNNGQNASDVWPAIYIDGFRDIEIADNYLTDTQEVKTQSKGIVAAINEHTRGILLGNNMTDGNIQVNGVLVPEEYLA